MARSSKLNKYLPKIESSLREGETVLAAVECTLEDKNSQVPGILSTGALALTSSSLVYLGGAGITSLKVSREILVSKISSIELESSRGPKSLRTAALTIRHFGGQEKFLLFPLEAEGFALEIRSLVDRSGGSVENKSDVSVSLERLAELFAKGLISQEEFSSAKTKLLES
jgi:hypothetical protein